MDSARITDLVGLRMLRAIRDGGSISSAALQFGYTQQAVSARMQRLESQLGLPLLTRGARGTTLSSEGVLLAEWSTEVLDTADRLRVAVDALRSSPDQHLRVSASLTIAEYLMPRWLVSLRRSPAHADIDVDLVSENSDSVIESVRTGAAALGFIETVDVPSDLEIRRIASDELVVVVAADHPWARARRGISVSELSSTPLVTREHGSGTRRSLELLLDEQHAAPLVPAAVQLQTAAAVRAAAASGIGPAVLSTLAVRDDIALGRLVPVRIRHVRLVRPLSAVWRPGQALGGAAQALLDVAAHEYL